jgi:hypothetical protein
MAEVNAAILRDASEEEILAEMEKLREEQRRFEEPREWWTGLYLMRRPRPQPNKTRLNRI